MVKYGIGTAAEVQFRRGIGPGVSRVPLSYGLRLLDPTVVDGIGKWSFFVDDGGLAPVVSFEDGRGNVLVNRWDPLLTGFPSASEDALSVSDFVEYDVYVPGTDEPRPIRRPVRPLARVRARLPLGRGFSRLRDEWTRPRAGTVHGGFGQPPWENS